MYVTRAGNVGVTLVTSKSRVVPVKKKYSILPRLELLGNFILSKLMSVVFNSLKEEIVINGLFCWSDSMICLAWIKSIDKEFKTFVENRLIKIRAHVAPNKWRYCKSMENPADVITRFNCCNTSKNALFYNGPMVLREFIDNDNGESNESVNGDSLPKEYFEEEKTSLVCVIVQIRRAVDEIINVEKFSEVNKLYRITSYVLRFVHNLRRNVRKEELILCDYVTTDELREAKQLWIKANQASLPELKNYEHLRKQLNLFEGENGLVRCKGRIGNANLPYDAKHPVLLNREHKLSELIVKDIHNTVKHRGEKNTLTEVRSKYWITQGKSFVKNVIHKCTLCRRYNTRSYDYPTTPELPKERLRDDVPFSATGVDYFGPLYAKNVFTDNSEEEELHKSFVALYTCASTRGIVLDLVKDASVTAFVHSFRRFICRRGCPQIMLSDNGRNFVAAETQQFAAHKNIRWKFSIVEAPWFGGFWERLVACVKNCIKKTIGRASLRFDELQTVLGEIELIINSRPLGPLYDDDLEEGVSPNHLMFGRKLETSNFSNEVVVTDDGDQLKRFRYMQTVLSHFWDGWSREYLTSLREFEINRKNKRNINIPEENDVVIVKEEKMPRQRWRLARITELIKGRDGQVRGAKVKIGKSRHIIERPVNKLYPIELANKKKEPVDALNDAHTLEKRPRRRAAIIGEIKRKFDN